MARKRTLEGNINEISKAMKECINPDESRRIQCVYLGILYPQMSAKQIGDITLFSESRVWAIHADYRKGGLSSLADSRGGRHREYMSFDEEVKFLEPFEKKSQTGALAVVGEVKKAYEAKIGKEVHKSTIYRILAKHNFRKIVLYKRHKKADIEAREAFKKLSGHSY